MILRPQTGCDILNMKNPEVLSIQYHIESYGCQMNDHDSEKIAGMLKAMGHTKADQKTDAGFIIFNTCCVREHAELRVFGNIGALKKRKDENPSLIIAVCGCMMQQEATANKLFNRFPFVDLVFGTHELENFPAMLQKVMRGERILRVNDGEEVTEGLPVLRNSAFATSVTIMYGCDNFCSYCIVPYVRGRERSRTSAKIVEEVSQLQAEGYKEVTLLGQNVNSYHGDGGKTDFSTLLGLVSDTGIERIRFMTSHPKDLSEKLIDQMASRENVCSHIHLPVQSGNNRILSLMNRQYTRESYISLIRKLRDRILGIEITTDIIVGFPTETEAEFNDTLSLMEEAGFSAAYTFMYSLRSGTKAAQMEGQIAKEVKAERLRRLNDAQADLLKKGNLRYIGTCGTVLVEGYDCRDGAAQAFGKLPNFKMVYFPGDESLVGQLVHVHIVGTKHNSLIAKRVS